MTSGINNTPDYFQFLGSRLPGFPSQSDKDPKDAAANGGIDLAVLLAMLGGDTSALDGASTKGVKNTQGTKAQGAKGTTASKYTREAATSHLPPPRAPRAAAGPQTAAAYASLADELHGAHTNAAKSTLENPEVQAADAKPWRTSTEATGEQAATQMTDKVGGMLDGMQAFQGDMLREFLALRVKNGSQGLKELGELSDLATAIQGTQLKEQQAKSAEADKEAKKAADKAAKMGIFSKVLTAVMAVITAILAVVTFGVGLPLLCIAAAAAIAFVVAGAVKGSKNGKGFDAMGGLEIASYVADGVMLAIGVGAAIMAVKTATKAASQGVLKGVTNQMVKGVSEAAEKSGTKAVVDKGTGQLVNSAGHMAVEDGSKTVTQETFKTLKEAGFKVIDASKERAAKEAAESAGKQVPEDILKVTSKVSSGKAIDQSAQMTMDNLMRSLNKQLAKKTLKDAATVTTKEKAAMFQMLFKGQLMQNMGKLGVTASDKLGTMGGKVLGESFGSQMMRLGLLTGAVQGGASLGQGIMQYQTTMHQTNAEEAQAVIKLLNATVEMLNGQYDTLQSTMQNISESRSKAIDSIQSMLKSDQQVNTMIANNYVTR